MNLWKNTVLTKKGMKLQTKLMKGSTLKITKIKTGTGRAEIVDLREQTEVLGAKQQLLVQEMKQGEEEVVIPVLLNNMDVAEPYTLWQVGFYAEDPEEGEILYCLAQAEEGKMIPSNLESPGFSVTWNFHFKVSNDISMEVNLDPAGLVSVETFEDWVEQSKQGMADVQEKLAQLNSDLTTSNNQIVKKANSIDLSNHINNPHTVTKEQIGLENVQNFFIAKGHHGAVSNPTGNKDYWINFGHTFSSPPTVIVCSAYSAYNRGVAAVDINTVGFNLRYSNATGNAATDAAFWVAIGN